MTWPTLRETAWEISKQRGVPQRLCEIVIAPPEIFGPKGVAVLTDGTRIVQGWDDAITVDVASAEGIG